jgi:hypothetical protein
MSVRGTVRGNYKVGNSPLLRVFHGKVKMTV